MIERSYKPGQPSSPITPNSASHLMAGVLGGRRLMTEAIRLAHKKAGSSLDSPVIARLSSLIAHWYNPDKEDWLVAVKNVWG